MHLHSYLELLVELVCQSHSAYDKKHDILVVSSCSHPMQWGDHWLLSLLCACGWWGEQYFQTGHSSRYLQTGRVHTSHLLQLLCLGQEHLGKWTSVIQCGCNTGRWYVNTLLRGELISDAKAVASVIANLI